MVLPGGQTETEWDRNWDRNTLQELNLLVQTTQHLCLSVPSHGRNWRDPSWQTTLNFLNQPVGQETSLLPQDIQTWWVVANTDSILPSICITPKRGHFVSVSRRTDRTKRPTTTGISIPQEPLLLVSPPPGTPVGTGTYQDRQAGLPSTIGTSQTLCLVAWW